MTTTEPDTQSIPPEVPGPFGAPVPDSEAPATLRADTLNLFDSTVVATASVAPAYGLAATMAALFLTAGVGDAGPAVIWISFVPVLFVAVAYFHLNRRHPDCGAAFAWLGRALSPVLGWLTGWVQLVASALFCIIGPGLAGAYTLQLFQSWGWVSAATAQSLGAAALLGAAWLVVVTAICVAGIRWTSNLQWVLLAVEIAAVVGLSVWGIVKVAVSHPAGSTGFHWAWLSPFSIGSVGALASGLVLGVFFFWGWDTAANLNEESRARTTTPGRAGVLAMLLLLFVFVLNIVAAQMLLPAKVWSSSNGTILFVFAARAAGHWATYVMVAAVLSSTVATTQTTLLPAARIALSMARARVLPRQLAVIHGSRRTPVVATLALAVLGMVGIVLVPTVHSVGSLLNDLVSNIGVLVAYYYGVTGLTCAWAYRRVALVRPGFFLSGIVLPAVGGLALLTVGGIVIAEAGWSGARADIITLVLGLPLAFVARWRSKGEYFWRRRVAYLDIDEEQGDEPRWTVPELAESSM
jgi:amino acid transporter